MAGAYPDAPAPRFAWDRDCAALWVPAIGSTPRVMTAAERLRLNDEAAADHITMGNNGHGSLVVLFPQPRDVLGHFSAITQLGGFDQYAANTWFETSTNTTDGTDGTWTERTSVYTNSFVSPHYRNGVKLVTGATGVIAVRWRTTGSWDPDFRAAHLYGVIPTGNRLAFWHPTLDQAIGGAHFDFGTVQQGTTSSISFRLKNLSATQTAGTITIGEEAPSDRNPSLLQQYEVRNSDGTSAALGSGTALVALGPNSISAVYNLVRTTAANAQIGLGAMRLVATAGTWST
jgi:hypothetical protein